MFNASKAHAKAEEAVIKGTPRRCNPYPNGPYRVAWFREWDRLMDILDRRDAALARDKEGE